MKRSLQEVVELVVFGLVALLVGTGLLWLVGWLLSLGGLLLKAIAGLLWLLLRFVVPVALVAGLVYFLVKALQGRQEAAPTAGSGQPAPHPQNAAPVGAAPTANADGSSTIVAPSATESTATSNDGADAAPAQGASDVGSPADEPADEDRPAGEGA
ncbi:MAG: hypothetical protein KF875_00710 [Trueperaceae bacterium]|nr:hypothetical protein [Trueperaceae bacterium]MCC6310314.1 hypothetical protein [Trueperaceae bacterium]MCO5172634.1 hypothetical protein [Trueperaceae bacterium]